MGGRQPGDVDDVLDRERDAVEGRQILGADLRGQRVSGVRGASRAVDVDGHVRAQDLVVPLDARQVLLEQLGRRHVSTPNRGRLCHCIIPDRSASAGSVHTRLPAVSGRSRVLYHTVAGVEQPPRSVRSSGGGR